MKRRRFIPFLLIIVLLLLACLVLAGFLAAPRIRSWFVSNRPLVLISQPANHQSLEAGRAQPVHATARAKSGITRFELWADSTLVAVREVEVGKSAPPAMTLHYIWEPIEEGHHTLLGRGFTPSGLSGQGSVFVEIVSQKIVSADRQAHFVAVGETIESIAADAGTTVDELEALNPELDGAAPQAGDMLQVPVPEGSTAGNNPDGIVPASDAPLPADDPPGADEDAAGIFEGLLELLNIPPLEAFPFPSSGDPLALVIEASALHSGAEYEGMHCYAAMGAGAPQWYPDEDGNQGSDESFASLGGGNWNIAAHLAGGRAIIVPSDENTPLPIDMTCVGVTGGGRQAVDLGSVALRVPPAAWDGVNRRAISVGGEDTFTLEYKVSRGGRRGFPIGIDLTMTRPENLNVVGSARLTWDYNPRADEGPVDGFRVYLNNTYLWSELANARSTAIAPEWLHPACGELNSFTVSAFRFGPDNPESLPSDPAAFRPPSPCSRNVLVRYKTLRIFELDDVINQGAQDEDPNHVGPGVGYFRIDALGNAPGAPQTNFYKRFDGRCSSGTICSEFYLQENREYNLPTLFEGFGWSGNDLPEIPIDQNGTLELYFIVLDDDPPKLLLDWGDDTVCEGSLTIPYNALDYTHEVIMEDGVMAGDNDAPYIYQYGNEISGKQCEVVVEINFSGPATDTGAPLAMPYLRVEDIRLEGGLLTLDIQNMGNATWAAQPLDVEVQPRQGGSPLRHTFPAFQLAPGENMTLSGQEITPATRPMDVCVTLDPDDLIPEAPYGEREPYCAPLPDLTVTGTTYDSRTDTLAVRIYNESDNPLVNGDIDLTITTADGAEFVPPEDWWQGVNIGSQDYFMASFGLGGARATFRNGYTVQVDPQDKIVEIQEANNTYSVAGAVRFRVTWQSLSFPYYPAGSGGDQQHTYNLSMLVGSQDTRVVNTLVAGPFTAEPGGTYRQVISQQTDVELYQDEALGIMASGNLVSGSDTNSLFFNTEIFSDSDNWGADVGIHPAGDCTFDTSGSHSWSIQPLGGLGEDQPPWTVGFTICRLE